MRTSAVNMAGVDTGTVRRSVAGRIATLKGRQDAGQLQPKIHAIDAAFRAPRDADGTLHIDPRDLMVSPLNLIDVGA